MSIFSLRKDVNQQHARTLKSQAKLAACVQEAKSDIRDKVTSPEALVGSFTAGLASGWVMSPSAPSKDSRREQSEDHEESASSTDKKKPTLLDSISDQLIMIVMSVVAAKVNEELTNAVKDI